MSIRGRGCGDPAGRADAGAGRRPQDRIHARARRTPRVEASRLHQTAAAEALRGTRLEAQAGAKPTLAVLDAEREAIAADTALTEAEGRLLVAAGQLDAVIGE